jgi:hypothetical protein
VKHLDLQNEFRELITQLRFQVESASAMGSYDIHKVAEFALCGTLRELYGWTALRNLNSEELNSPGIDLADDIARVAVQVTATADLTKIKHTIEIFINRGLNQKYDRLVVFILSKKQSSYSQASVDTSTNGHLTFSAGKDIWDYQDLCAKAAGATPQQLQAVVNHLKAYMRGTPVGLADEDIDPPIDPPESLLANLVELYLPTNLYIAQLSAELVERHGKRRPGQMRTTISEFNKELKKPVPSGYVTHGGSIISLMDLTDSGSPFRHLIEPGTSEEHRCDDFINIDPDRERVLKSLLRSTLQQRLFVEHVRWEHEERQFIFLPREDGQNQRYIEWRGEKTATRAVFDRKYSKKDQSKILQQKHLSFAVQFIRLDGDWYMSITPSWFFSFGPNFNKSNFAFQNLSWIKRQETNQAVMNHFRFIATWLKSIDEETLFSADGHAVLLSFGNMLSLSGAPSLDESKWLPLSASLEDEDDIPGRLFD